MIGITLGEKRYTVPFFTGRALRSIGGIDDIYKRASEEQELKSTDMDTAVEWVCLLFKNQFTPDDVYDNYPVDSFWLDLFMFYIAVKKGMTDKLEEFPTKPGVTES